MAPGKNTQRRLRIKGPGQLVVEKAGQIPQFEDDEVLVRVAAVAINPFDSKSVDLSPSIGATPGCDYAGTVVSVGSKAKTGLQTGDRVCGWVFGNNPDRLDNGAFAEFTAAPADLVLRIPEHMSFEQASTVGVGIGTAGMALFHTLGLPLPLSTQGDKQFVLVNGGATATGTLAIQLLQLSGLSPIATCSPRNYTMVKQLGCVAAFDYRSPSCASDILAATNGQLRFALDCITTTASMRLCYEAIGGAGGRYLSLDPFPLRSHIRRSKSIEEEIPANPPDIIRYRCGVACLAYSIVIADQIIAAGIKPETIVCLTQFGKPITKPYKRAARPQDREFARKWFLLAEYLLMDGLIKPHPHKVMGGLEHIVDGVDLVRKGQVAGSKLVYKVASQ